MSRFRWAPSVLSTASLLSCLLIPSLGLAEAPPKPPAASDPPPLKVTATDGVADTPELRRVVRWDLQEQPLIEALLTIEKQAGIPVLVHRTLAERGRKADRADVSEKSIGQGFRRPGAAEDPDESPKRITSRVVDLPLWAALDTFVQDARGPFFLGWRYNGGCLEISTYNQAADRRSIRQYDLEGVRKARIPLHGMVDLLEENLIGPWDRHEPGTGTCQVVGSSLVVRGNDANHRSVRALLAALTTEDADEIFVESPTPNEALTAALDAPFEPRLVDVPLREALQILSEGLPSPIRMTADAEEASPTDSPRRIRLEIPARPRREVVKLVLDQLSDDLVLTVRGNAPVVAKAVEESESRSLRLYNIEDAEVHGRVPEFVQAVLRCTSGSWELDEPGTGVLTVAGPGQLLVWQNESTHRQLRELVRAHRSVWQKDNGSPRRMETRVYWVRSDLAEPLATLLRETVSPSYWNTPGQGHLVRAVVPGAVDAPAAAAPAPAGAGNTPPPWKPLRSWPLYSPLSLGQFDSYPALSPMMSEYGAEARVDLRGDPSKESQVFVIRAPFELHRQIDERVEQFLTLNSTFRILGLPPQLGFLMPNSDISNALPGVSAVAPADSLADPVPASRTEPAGEL